LKIPIIFSTDFLPLCLFPFYFSVRKSFVEREQSDTDVDTDVEESNPGGLKNLKKIICSVQVKRRGGNPGGLKNLKKIICSAGV